MEKVIPADAKLMPENAQRVFKGIMFDVYQWNQEMFDGSTAVFERLRRPDTVMAVCIVDDQIIIQEDEQPHRGVKSKLPGGRVDAQDDSTLTAVKREVLEETGYEFANWRLIEVTKPEDKIDWFVYIYLASGVLSKSVTSQDAGERIKPTLKSVDEVKSMIDTDTSGFLSKSRQLFRKISSLDDLVNMPEFKGKIVNV